MEARIYGLLENRIYDSAMSYFGKLMEAREHHTEVNVYCSGRAQGKVFALIDFAVAAGMTEDYTTLLYRKARKSFAVQHNMSEEDL